ncbi:uncharacterized protein BDR25DRAFT_353023 [Lindgomyces ingoldianus]|uniref:Uncharacterized protein n=1 Tax=Lindgomyces ingoldianus TaxID=673940 RepID=A0ACB6R081_9PLEO|nr:uncharacterized protein BDR25DRAFT_353023 [Lindgomyces ingoldianus]KAF2472704.1 hypothetical protein BDR25DRAFT_353023 [Lindgomyces ingoldianus]
MHVIVTYRILRIVVLPVGHAGGLSLYIVHNIFRKKQVAMQLHQYTAPALILTFLLAGALTLKNQLLRLPDPCVHPLTSPNSLKLLSARSLSLSLKLKPPHISTPVYLSSPPSESPSPSPSSYLRPQYSSAILIVVTDASFALGMDDGMPLTASDSSFSLELQWQAYAPIQAMTEEEVGHGEPGNVGTYDGICEGWNRKCGCKNQCPKMQLKNMNEKFNIHS